MKIKNFIKEWLIPPKILLYILNFNNKFKIKRADLEVIKKNKDLKDIHNNQRCFIIGNGPSVNDVDILKIKNEVVFVLSSFYHSDKYKELSPVYHSIVNVVDAYSDMEKYLILKEMDDRTLSKKIFIGIGNKYIIDRYNLFENKDVYYIATANLPRKFSIDTVTGDYITNPLQALEIAFFMGFKEIYLLGIEYNEICSGNYSYFYGRSKMKFADPQVNDDNIPAVKLSVTLQATLKAVIGFEEFKDYADKENIKIYNLSKHSILKMFPYREFDDVYNETETQK